MTNQQAGMPLWVREIGPTIKLAMPIMGGMVAQMLMGVADTIMVGQLGTVPLAAASFVNIIAHPPMVFALGLLTAVGVLTAQSFGAGRPREAGEVLRSGFVIAAVVGCLIALGLWALRFQLHRLGQPPEVVAEAGTYLVLFGWSILPAVLGAVARQFSESLNHPWVPTWIMLGGVLLNIFLNWLLIYGNWGFPRLELEGAGWATIIARVVMLCALIAWVFGATAFKEFRPLKWFCKIEWKRTWRMLRLGGPVSLQHLLEVSAFAFAGMMMGWISAEALAAHQVAITCASTTFMFALGLGMAVSIRVGQAFGAGELPRMRRIGFVGLGLGGAGMALFAIPFILIREPIARAFVSSPEVVGLAGHLLVVAAFFQIVDGLQVTAISALRGLSDVRVPAMVAVLAYWVVAVPLGYALGFGAKWGAAGIWIGLAIGLGVAAAGLGWRFHWKTVVPKILEDREGYRH